MLRDSVAYKAHARPRFQPGLSAYSNIHQTVTLFASMPVSVYVFVCVVTMMIGLEPTLLSKVSAGDRSLSTFRGMSLHVCPLTVLESGRASLAHKFACLAHTCISEVSGKATARLLGVRHSSCHNWQTLLHQYEFDDAAGRGTGRVFWADHRGAPSLARNPGCWRLGAC